MPDFANEREKNIRFQITLNEEQKQAKSTILENSITYIAGKAGSGKTLVSCQVALDLFFKKQVKHIIITRPAVEAGEKLGFLPGGLEEKLDPYVQAIYQNFYSLYKKDKIDSMIKEGSIQIKPFAYMRGSTFCEAVIIVDECLTADSIINVEFNNNSTSRLFNSSTLSSIIKKFKNNKEIKVLSYNSLTNKIEQKKVIDIFEMAEKQIFDIYTGLKKKPISASENHPFAILKNGEIVYTKVKDLKKGDTVLRAVNKNSNNSRILKKENYDVLLGLLLGDGCLSKNKQDKLAFRLSKTHGLSQENYNSYCADIFNGNLCKGLISGYTGKPLCGMQTKSLYLDQDFVNSIKNFKNKKEITKNIINYFTERTLAFWYMDDGSLDASNRVRLHTESFSKEENEILINILKEKFNITAELKYTSKNKGYYYLTINKENSKLFFNLVKNYIQEDLLYKLPKEYSQEKFIKVEPLFFDDLSTSEITEIKTDRFEPVYNITVEDNNNFFVDGILTHNCQNTTESQVKMVLERLGKGSKMMLCGDINQIDLGRGITSGIKFLDFLQEKELKNYTKIVLKTNHRDPIVEEILNLYESFKAQ